MDPNIDPQVLPVDPTVAVETPVVEQPVAPEQEGPRFSKDDYEKIQSVDDAKKFRDQLNDKERDAWDKGELSSIFGDKPATVGGEPAPEPPGPILTPEEYETADPRTKAMQDEIIELNEKLEKASAERPEDPAFKELRELITRDPVLKNRIELAYKGEAALPQIDIPPEAFLTDEQMKALDDAFITDDGLVSAKAKMAEFVKKVYAEAAMRVKVNIEGEYQEKAAVAENKLWYQTNIMEFVRASKDYTSSEPVFVTTDAGTSINHTSPVRPFIAWLTQEVQEGRVTHEAIKAHGLAAYDQLYRIKNAGGVSNFNAQSSQKTKAELLKQLALARNKAVTQNAAPMIKPTAQNAPPAPTWYEFDLNRLKVDKAYAEDAISRLKNAGRSAHLNELVTMAQKW